ncbi:MAG: AtpZ/AtpI family protein [Pseudobdellovibrionaceae bacterium]
MPQEPKDTENRRKILIFASIGFELVGLVLSSVYIGGWLDQSYQGKGLYTVSLILLSLVSWLVRVIWLLKKLEK